MAAISPLAQRWNDAVAAGEGLPPAAFLSSVRQAGVVYGDRPLCTFRRPLFIPRRLAGRYLKILPAFHQAIRAAREMIEADGLDGRPGSLAIRLGVEPDALALAAIDPGYRSASVLARLDSFFADEHPQILELNAESPAGMAYGDALADLFRAQEPLLPEPSRVTAMRSADAAARAVLATWRSAGGRGSFPVVGIVDFMDVPTRPEFLLLQDHFEKMGITCLLADPRDLVCDGGRLLLDGTPLDVVHRRLLVVDALRRPADCAALIEAYRTRAVCVVNSFRTALLHGKGLLALLHAPELQERLPPSVRRIVQRHLPATYLVSDEPALASPPDLRERLRREKDEWVLKPVSGHGGAGVALGHELDQAAWERALDAATHHVAQRRVRPVHQPFPDAAAGYALRSMQCSLDPFLIQGHLAGFLCRLSTGLANVAEGASQVPVFIEDE